MRVDVEDAGVGWDQLPQLVGALRDQLLGACHGVHGA
jgi:hypothetical protein